MSFLMRTVVGAMSVAKKLSGATGAKNPVDSIIRKEKHAQIPAMIYEKYGAYYRTMCNAQVMRLDPENGDCPNELIFIHGGGYMLPMTQIHWGMIDKLMEVTRAKAAVPQYLRAPEHTAEDAFILLDEVFERCLCSAKKTGGKIIMAGDSAGAGMALAYAMNRRDRGLQIPDHLILISPWLDLSLANPEAEAMNDPMLNVNELRESGVLWAGNWDIQDPRVSPYYGSLENLPTIQIFQGKYDLLYPDARDFSRRAVTAGAPVHLTVSPTGFHVYLALPYLPESRQAYREISEFFKK